jgi:hypothetical protein
MSLGTEDNKKCFGVQMNLKRSNEKCLSDYVINEVPNLP